jgi:hypothetical protein
VERVGGAVHAVTRRVAAVAVVILGAAGSVSGQDPIDESPGVNVDSAGGGTIVAVEGSIVQIAVSLDVLVPEPLEGTGPLPQHWFDRITDGMVRATEYWNDRLNGKLAGNCFPIEVSTATRFVFPGESSSGGGHDVRLHPFYDPMFVTPLLTTETQNSDTAQVFVSNGTAYFPYWVFNNARVLAHELGHVFGLGDDLTLDANGDAVGTYLPGREDTLMGAGDDIDQALVDRVGDLADRSGVDIPLCLSGLWVDDNNGRDTCIVQTGAEIVGDYLETRECDHNDGTGAAADAAAPKATNGESLSHFPANPGILEDAVCRVPDPDLGGHGKAEP